MRSNAAVSRRQLFQGGAAFAGATVLASSGGAAAGAVTPHAVGGAGAAAVVSFDQHELAVPIWDFATAGNDPLIALGSPARRYASSLSTLMAPVRLPAGAALVRVDAHGYNDVNTSQLWQLVRFTLGDPASVVLAETTLSGTGAVTGTVTFDPATPAPYTLAANEFIGIGCVEADQQRAVVGARVVYTVPTAPSLVPISPRRVYDSRTAGTKLTPGEERTISVAAAADGSGEVVPAGATAVAITFTVTDTEGAEGGYAAVYPAGAAWAGTSSVNWFGVGQHLATAAVVGLGGDRSITLRGGVAPTHCVVDVSAYLV